MCHMLTSSDLEMKKMGLVSNMSKYKESVCPDQRWWDRQAALWGGREIVKDRIKTTEGLECGTKAFDKEGPLEEGDPVCILES